MSVTYVTNSAIPSFVGWSALAAGILSCGSLLADGPAIINVTGGEVIDFAASALTGIAGLKIISSRDPTAGWLGLGIIVMGIAYAGVQVNTQQAGRMFEAAKSAAAAGATAAGNNGKQVLTAGVSSKSVKHQEAEDTNPNHYLPLRMLKPREMQGCENGEEWAQTPAGKRNCSLATDKQRYVWVTKQWWAENQGKYEQFRELTAEENAECVAGKLPWTVTLLGKLNCTVQSDGKRYVWVY